VSPRRHRNPQKRKPPMSQYARSRGIVAVRRPVAPQSQEVFANIIDDLNPEVRKVARLFEPNTLGVTLIGFSRFTKADVHNAPPVLEVCQKVPSTLQFVSCQLGRFAVFGSGRKHKLGVTLTCQELTDEIHTLEATYARRGISLKHDSNNPNEHANLHCSLALLYGEFVGQFQDVRTLDRLDGLCSDLLENEVFLGPVSL
jgi:hypothetical protein